MAAAPPAVALRLDACSCNHIALTRARVCFSPVPVVLVCTCLFCFPTVPSFFLSFVLSSHPQGGHFELGKTWKRIRQAGGGHSNQIGRSEFMTAIGDLGFSDGEIKKLFDFWDMDGR